MLDLNVFLRNSFEWSFLCFLTVIMLPVTFILKIDDQKLDQTTLKPNLFSQSSVKLHFSYIRHVNCNLLKDLSVNDLGFPILFQNLIRSISEGRTLFFSARTKSWESDWKRVSVWSIHLNPPLVYNAKIK